MVPAASVTISASCVVTALVGVWWGRGMGKRKQISKLLLETEEARREGGRGDVPMRQGGREARYCAVVAERPGFVNKFCV